MVGMGIVELDVLLLLERGLVCCLKWWKRQRTVVEV